MSKPIHRIDAVAKPGGIAPNGKAYARLEYYMPDQPGQEEWRKIPGYVIAEDEATALKLAEDIADKLDGLTLSELPEVYRQLFADDQSALQKSLD